MAELQRFKYDAPDTFLNFEDLENEDVGKVEAFFEMEHNYNDEIKPIIIDEGERDLDQSFFTPLKETPEKPSEKCVEFNLRKSISLEGLPIDKVDEVDNISNAMNNLHMSARASAKKRQSQRMHPMLTRSLAPLNLRSRSISRDNLEKLAQPKYRNKPHDDVGQRFVSMAEAINQFQQKTPKRFHSKPTVELLAKTQPSHSTVPQSPALATKSRVRVTTAISREQQEIKDFEDAKKFKIKANPLNARIFSAPQVRPVVKKVTQVEPFKLTEPSRSKTPTPKQDSYIFHAKPVPKCVFQTPQPIIKSSLRTTAHTPLVLKHRPRVEPTRAEPVKAEAPVEKGPVKAGPTKPVPFSFEQRNKELLKKREQLLNEVLQEEKKAREFHAKPIPKSVFKSPQNKSVSTYIQKRQRSDPSIASTDSTDVASHTFKARPAKVLQMKPFEPKKELNYTMTFAEVHLNTEKRAKDREDYDCKIREKELQTALLKQQQMEEMLRMEEQERVRIRKEMEHKAQPIRHYKELPLVVTKKVTSPKSPKFGNLKSARQNENKENVTNTNGF